MGNFCPKLLYIWLVCVCDPQEFFGDYIAVAHHLFSFNLSLIAHPGCMWKRDEFLRVSDGLISIMLALRKRPVIR